MGCTLAREMRENRLLSSASIDRNPLFTLQGIRTHAKIVDVYDGDTASLAVRHPFPATFRVRLLGIDTEELRQPKSEPDRERKKELAFAARNRLIELGTGVSLASDPHLKGEALRTKLSESRRLVWAEFGQPDKFGRALVSLFVRKNGVVSINQRLIDEHLALPYDGGTKTNVTEGCATTQTPTTQAPTAARV